MGETLVTHEGVTDGRTSRAARTRANIVDAVLALIDRGNLRPTAREIADEAGVSLRSVYVHFDDVESLHVAAAARLWEHVDALWEPVPATGPVEERLETFVDRMGRMHEAGAQVRRAAVMREPFSPALQHAFERGHRARRKQVERAFAPELARVPEAERPRLVAQLAVTVSPATWDTLRTYQKLAPDEAAELVRDMMAALWRARGIPVPTGTNDDTDDQAGR